MTECQNSDRFEFNRPTRLCASHRKRWCIVDVTDPLRDTSQLLITTKYDFDSKSSGTLVEVEPNSEPNFENIENVPWEVVCTYREPQAKGSRKEKPVSCQRKIESAGEDFVCLDKCNVPEAHVYASRIIDQTNHHLFKPTSNLCKSAAFAGIPPNTPFRVIPTDEYPEFVPMIHNGIESELGLSEKGFQLEADEDISTGCFDYINIERNTTMEVWASTERQSEIYETDRRWEARHAFSNNDYQRIPWAAKESDNEPTLTVDFKQEFRINRLQFMNVIQFEPDADLLQNFYCNKTEIYFSNDNCYDPVTFTLYKTVDAMTKGAELSLTDVSLNAKCLKFYPKDCNQNIATLKLHLYGCPAGLLPKDSPKMVTEATLGDLLQSKSDLVILFSGVLVAVIAMIVLIITLCNRNSSRSEPKRLSETQSLNLRLNYDRVSNSYQPVILRVESNGVLTDVGTLQLPRLVPEETQSAIVRSPTDQLPDVKPSKLAIQRALGNPYLDENRWREGNTSITQSEQDNVYSDIDEDYLSRQAENELLRAQSTSALDTGITRTQKKTSFRPSKPPRRSKKKKVTEPHSYHSLESARNQAGQLKDDPYNKLLLDL